MTPDFQINKEKFVLKYNKIIFILITTKDLVIYNKGLTDATGEILYPGRFYIRGDFSE